MMPQYYEMRKKVRRKAINRSIVDKLFGRPNYEIEYFGDTEVE